MKSPPRINLGNLANENLHKQLISAEKEKKNLTEYLLVNVKLEIAQAIRKYV